MHACMHTAHASTPPWRLGPSQGLLRDEELHTAELDKETQSHVDNLAAAFRGVVATRPLPSSAVLSLKRLKLL